MKKIITDIENFIWLGGNGQQHSIDDILLEIKKYTRKGGKIFVGTDSMTYPSKCHFACVIALHSTNPKVARYFYKKIKLDGDKYKNLQVKIFKEVEYSVMMADFLREQFPNADIEVHVDIGENTRSETRKFIQSVRGWILSSGFRLKIKPESWAASSVADSHTK